MEQFNEDKIYSVIRNKTKNQKAVLSSLNGIEIAPGETVNLRAMFRKAQLVDATRDIYHFIYHNILEEVNETPVNPVPVNPEQPTVLEAEAKTTGTDKPKAQIQSELQTKIREAKVRDLILEISDCTLLSRLEDVLTSPETLPEVKKAAKIQYMKLRGWANDEGELIEGSVDDDNQDITSIDGWEFKPFSVAKATGGNIIQ